MSEIPSDKDNFLRFVCFFIDVGTETVLKVFYYIQLRNPSILTFPISRTAPIAKQVQNAFVKSQYYNVTNATSPDDFDINTLITLLRTLFSGVLPTPSNGWWRRPASGDYSISADLLRLRSIRNDIVAHINRASLPSADFNKLWKTVEDILKRLVKTVDPVNEEKLKETFETYTKITIGASIAEKIIGNLKKQLEELTQTLHDFILLWKNKRNTPFARYIKLLVDGGRLILTAYLNKLIQDNNVSLEITLLEQHALVSEVLDGNQVMLDQVYPKNKEDIWTANTKTTTWDISVLSKVIESCFTEYVDEDERNEIKAVREARENYAYAALYAVTSDERFYRAREDLVVNLSLLAKGIGGNSKKEFNRIKYDGYSSSSDEITSEEVDVYLDQLKWPGQDVNDIHEECVDNLKKELSIEEKMHVNIKENFELEIMIQLACQDIEKQEEAESTLYTIIEKILADPDSETTVGSNLSGVRETLASIRNIPTVELTCVKKSCILITVESNSTQALIRLVDYVDSPMFQNQLNDISIELMDTFDEVFILKGHFTLESIQKTLIKMEEKISENKSEIPDDEYVHGGENIHSNENMLKEAKHDILSQSQITTIGRQHNATSSVNSTELETVTKSKPFLVKSQGYQQTIDSHAQDTTFLEDYSKHTEKVIQFRNISPQIRVAILCAMLPGLQSTLDRRYSDFQMRMDILITLRTVIYAVRLVLAIFFKRFVTLIRRKRLGQS